MKKSKLKFAVKKAMKPYYKAGMTNMAAVVQKDIMNAIDRAYSMR